MSIRLPQAPKAKLQHQAGSIPCALNRRSFLAGSLAASTALWSGRPVYAAPLAFGSVTVEAISDGSLTLPVNFVLPDQNAAEIESLFKPYGLATDALLPDCNVTLLRIANRVVLFDAGAGPNFQATAGQLGANMEAAGISPEEITDVIFTHGHPDHLWGVLDDFGDPLFASARHWVPQGEWDYWRAEDTLANTPDDRKSLVAGAQTRLEAIADMVDMVTDGMEVLPGVEAISTPGHTPGHMSYMLHSGGESLLVTGDAISNSVISFERPDWHSGTDQDPVLGARTRSALLDRIATERTRILGYHLPHPGLGMAERKGTAYRFVPA
ncbi:MBL fold metallo-hydrolase [Roseibium suaedae]|uniref:Glyoxylase, beta-lactamase superfamily II n=1 Tax=Roseibium suaedae TaxID=735517 RepID=A0A1M7FAE3_9HYPH|nr:MBL fold metallo-hydrolase [Roseibium suaedae]SHM01052.1 Glyoxylase, beta-lactamase superfamily II [Roseibium suaedae]